MPDLSDKVSDRSKDILELARALKETGSITIEGSGDREPDPTVSKLGRKWIIEGLKLLASSTRFKGPAGRRPDDIPEEVWHAATGAVMGPKITGALFSDNYILPVASAIMADRRTRSPASSMEGETEHKRPTFEEVRARAVAAVLALDDWTNVNETEFTGWGDGDVPPIAEWWRVKSGQARKALEELFPPAASPIPPEVMK